MFWLMGQQAGFQIDVRQKSGWVWGVGGTQNSVLASQMCGMVKYTRRGVALERTKKEIFTEDTEKLRRGIVSLSLLLTQVLEEQVKEEPLQDHTCKCLRFKPGPEEVLSIKGGGASFKSAWQGSERVSLIVEPK